MIFLKLASDAPQSLLQILPRVAIMIFFLYISQRSQVLVQTKEVTMKPEDVARIFGSEDYKIAADKGL